MATTKYGNTPFNRRGFIMRAGLASAGVAGSLLLPNSVGAQTLTPYAPFSQGDFQWMMGICNEAYVQAFIRDPSNAAWGGALPSLSGGDAGFTAALEVIDAACSANGIYAQNYDASQIPSLLYTNTAYWSHAMNMMQVGLKKDYFSLAVPALQTINANDGGFDGRGSTLQNTIASTIALTSQWRIGNYSMMAAIPRTHSNFVPVRFHRDGTSIGQSIALGASLCGAGGALFTAGGGFATLTAGFTAAAVVATAPFIATAIGVTLFAVGVGFLVYAATRLVMQINGQSGPFERPQPEPGDPPYLRRIQNRAPLWPPIDRVDSVDFVITRWW